MNNTEIIKKSLMKRHLAESRFKTYGILRNNIGNCFPNSNFIYNIY